ncbi:hypothetical protein ACOBQX_13680 [Actinokineospora sp. G85]
MSALVLEGVNVLWGTALLPALAVERRQRSLLKHSFSGKRHER